MFAAFNGHKTYIVAGIMLVHAALGYYLGQPLDTREILEALAIAGLRHGISKVA